MKKKREFNRLVNRFCSLFGNGLILMVLFALMLEHLDTLSLFQKGIFIFMLGTMLMNIELWYNTTRKE